MKKMLQRFFLSAAVCCVALCYSTSVSAQMLHTIMYGGSLGQSYAPQHLTVAVGDTIEWVGDGGATFDFHPLSPDVFPNGALLFDPITTGETFRYLVQVEGVYSYYCQQHGTPGGGGMAGDFTAQGASVHSKINSIFSLESVSPNPASRLISIQFSMKKASIIALKILSIDGKEIAVLRSNIAAEGMQSEQYDVSSLASGTYLISLESGDAIVSEKLIVR